MALTKAARPSRPRTVARSRWPWKAPPMGRLNLWPDRCPGRRHRTDRGAHGLRCVTACHITACHHAEYRCTECYFADCHRVAGHRFGCRRGERLTGDGDGYGREVRDPHRDRCDGGRQRWVCRGHPYRVWAHMGREPRADAVVRVVVLAVENHRVDAVGLLAHRVDKAAASGQDRPAMLRVNPWTGVSVAEDSFQVRMVEASPARTEMISAVAVASQLAASGDRPASPRSWP
jgi:hypothetical protein